MLLRAQSGLQPRRRPWGGVNAAVQTRLGIRGCAAAISTRISPTRGATLVASDYRTMRLIFDPSRVRLYIKPFWSKMKPMTGLRMVLVSMAPPAPTVMMATDPSTPTFQPSVAGSRQRRPGHEHDDDRACLRAELEADRGRDGVEVSRGPAANAQRALAILAADPDAGLDDGREDQNSPRPCWPVRVLTRPAGRSPPSWRARLHRFRGPRPPGREALDKAPRPKPPPRPTTCRIPHRCPHNSPSL